MTYNIVASLFTIVLASSQSFHRQIVSYRMDVPGDPEVESDGERRS